MAITPRTILTSAAPATVAVVSLYLFTAVGTIAYKSARDAQNSYDFDRYGELNRYEHDAHAWRNDACNQVLEVFGADKRGWSETAWVSFAYCYEQQNNSRMTIAVASQGLRYHPQSESLYNMVGYHQIMLGDYEQAVRTLRTGIEQVAQPRSGVMANNLAWAGLWAPRSMRIDEARAFYQRSLALSPDVCETLHTGLWVEYAASRRAEGVERYDALKRFDALRQRYEPCMQRAERGEWNTMMEVVGAAVLFEDVDRDGAAAADENYHPRMLQVAEQLRANFRGASIDNICREAMPLGETHHLCVDRVHETVQHLKSQERHQVVEKRRRCRYSNTRYQMPADNNVEVHVIRAPMTR